MVYRDPFACVFVAYSCAEKKLLLKILMNKHYPITLSLSTNNIINNIVKSLSAVPQGRHSCHFQMNEDQKQRGYYWQPFLDHIENVIIYFLPLILIYFRPADDQLSQVCLHMFLMSSKVLR